MQRTRYGLTTDARRTEHGLETDGLRTGYGQHTDMERAIRGLHTDGRRTRYGHGPFAGRMSSGRVCVRPLFVLRSVVVRSRPVWRSCAAAHRVNRRRIVDAGASTSGHGNGELCAKRHTAYALTCGGILTDKTRTCHGQHTGLPTDIRRATDGRASVRLGQTQTRQDGRRRGDGLSTDWKRSGGALRITRPTIDARRAAHGLTYGLLTGGRRAGFGQTWTNTDTPRWAAARRADLPRTGNGQATGYTRTGNGLAAR